MSEWPRYYVLVGRTPMAVDMMTWAKCFGESDRHIGNDIITPRCHVTTVFLGLDHNFMRTGEPILFETLIFGGPLDGDMYRYRTYDEAEHGHAAAVAAAKIACARVDAIAQASGAKTEG